MLRKTPNIKLLEACVDEVDESYFRFLVDETFIKYVKIDGGLYDIDDMCFGPAMVPLLPDFPAGNWNEGHIAIHPQTGRPHFKRTTREQLPGVRHVWHPIFFDYLEFELGKKLRSNVYEATCPRFKSTVIVKFARFSWEIQYMDTETLAYKWIEGFDIGPRFLGHLMEEDRVIGFVMEKIENGRDAGPADLPLCSTALSRLHNVGIIHGDINKHNFIVQSQRVTLIDFDSSRKCADRNALQQEASSLLEQLADTSGRGGWQIVTDISE